MGYWIDTSDPGRLYSGNRQIPFWCSKPQDINSLPGINRKGVQQGEDTVSCLPVGPGSRCTCIEESAVYILDEDDRWKKL